MTIIVNSFLAAIGAGLLTLLIMAIKWMWKKIRCDDLAIKALAHDAYFRQARYLLQKETITEAELENHDYLWRAYKGQGLNGTGEKLHDQILKKNVVAPVPDQIRTMLP